MKALNIILCFGFLLMSIPASAQVAPDPFSVGDDIQTLLLQLQDAQKKYTPAHPEIVRLRAELQQVQQIQRAPFGTPSPAPLSPKLVGPGSNPSLANLQMTLRGTFWRNPDWVKNLELTTDQQNKMDDVYQQYRLKLIDLTASLQKEELILEPLIGRNRPTPDVEAKIMTQVDRIADARAELEKANSRMLISILGVLTADQWTKLPTQTGKKGFFVFPSK